MSGWRKELLLRKYGSDAHPEWSSNCRGDKRNEYQRIKNERAGKLKERKFDDHFLIFDSYFLNRQGNDGAFGPIELLNGALIQIGR